MSRIDAHHHLWDPSRGDYGWLKPDQGGLYRTYAPADLEPILRAHDVDGTLVVQAAPSEAETDYLLDLARKTPWILGVIGWVDLESGGIADRIALMARDPLVVGIRPMLQGLDDRAWILRPELDHGLAALTEHQMAFDALLRSDQLSVLAELARRYPELTIILDHGGKPQVSADGPDKAWLREMALLAAHGNVACKLSGLLTEAPPGADEAIVRPYFEALLAAFGSDRLIWGSDWPVLTLAGAYGDWMDMVLSLLPSPAHAAVMGGNAKHHYRLGAPR
ncbi:amidohydrolase family protein [Caulobacter sp. DWP3-1-3b2]|uniref:amidohydrolase family protein n=1 Tax=Caulobacter sp. DWP3-1-3b2 TaxID=2804643 RepID=UPI003CF522BF